MTHAADRLLRVREVATRWECHQGVIYRLIETGDLRCVRIGRLVRVPESALDEFIAAGGAKRAS